MESARRLAAEYVDPRVWRHDARDALIADKTNAFEWLLAKQHADLDKILDGYNNELAPSLEEWWDQFVPGGKYGPDPEPEPFVATEADSTVVRKGNNIVHVEPWVADAIRADERKRLGR